MSSPLRSLLALISVTALLALAACNTQSPGASGGDGGKINIGVGGQTVLTYLPVTLADQLGYFEDEGLDVELQDLQGGSKALKGMLGGSTTVTSGYYEHTIQMQAKNQDIKAFAVQATIPGLVLLVAPGKEKEIKSIKDLKGKTVGVTAPGSSTDMFVRYLLAKEKMKPEDISISGIGAGSTAVAAVEKGNVDAAVLIEPAVTQLEKKIGKTTKKLGDLRDPANVETVFGSRTWPASVLYAQTDWLDEHAKEARKLAKALVRALKWAESHSGKEIAAKMPKQFAGGNPEEYATVIDASKKGFSTDGKMPEEGAEAVLETQRVANPEVGDADIELKKTFTNEFLD
ncbi:ABC transporter substrate-binding protein [Aeromicrobium sp.]|uniref:ABC transporter substrate-binding protein n=1 Tax=Aeromicrobium sp. TaxID=1871063 RepID=UPI0019BC1B00|nr:ABC transporter substrate-binding protein [Aeromicrobium sp.]MBC7631772.1 ABC transporter substrate-binding protein [Aeromicrobium sp.]